MIWRGSSGPSDAPEEEQGHDEPNPEADPGSVGNRIESVLDAAERAAVGIREDAQEWARRYLDESRRKADDAAAQRMQEISSLTDSLVSRAKAVAAQSDELIAALDDAGRRMLNNARRASQSTAPPPPGNDHPQGAAPPASVPPTQAERPPSARVASLPASPPRQPPAQPRRAAPPVREVPPTPQQAPAQPPQPAPAAPPAQQSGDAAAPRVSEGARLLATQMAVAGSSRDEIAWRLREEFGIEDASAILDEIGI